MPDDPARGSSALLLLHREDPGARRIALLAALLLHLLLISVTLPSIGAGPPPRRVVNGPVRVNCLPPVEMLPSRPVSPAVQDELQPRLVPVPDPDPVALEPIREAPAPAAAAPSLVGTIEVLLPHPEAPPVPGPRTPGHDGVTFPEIIEGTRVLPRYPPAARVVQIEGTVILRAVVRSDGSVGRIEVLRAPAAELGFEKAAVDAVRRWRYRPGRQGDRPVDVYFTIVVDFVLDRP